MTGGCAEAADGLEWVTVSMTERGEQTMPDETPKLAPLRAFRLMRSEEYPNFAVLELTTPSGTVRYAVTREILETLSSNMVQTAGKMPKAETAPAKGAGD
jgi:hypothetical protein